MVLKLALRNLFRNTRRSMVVFLLFAVVTALFFLGNAFLDAIGRGLQTSYNRNFTGDIVLKTRTLQPVCLFGAVIPTVEEYTGIPELPLQKEVESVLAADGRVSDYTFQLTGAAVLDIGGARYSVPLFGVDGPDYFRFFPDIVLEEGSLPSAQNRGVVISASRARRIAEDTGHSPVPGEDVLLSMFGNGGFRIRQVPLLGIFHYPVASPVLDEIVLSDAPTLRALNALSQGGGQTVEISSESEFLLDSGLDDLFAGSADSGGADSGGAELGSADSARPDSGGTLLGGRPSGLADAGDTDAGLKEIRDGASALVSSLLRPETPPETAAPADGGSWNFMLLRLKPGVSEREFLKEWNEEGSRFADLEALNWRQAAGPSALFSSLIRSLYNTGFSLIAIAGIIALSGILIISVSERTGEIGTLRSIGASRSVVYRMVMAENLVLAGGGGVAGLLLGLLVRALMNRARIVFSNSLLVIILGQQTLHVGLSGSVVLISLGMAVLLGCLVSVLPLRVALSVAPVTAASRGLNS